MENSLEIQFRVIPLSDCSAVTSNILVLCGALKMNSGKTYDELVGELKKHMQSSIVKGYNSRLVQCNDS